jgi:hypothetical protein
VAINPDLPARCEDYPCCGHTDGLPCNWVPGPEIYKHAGCDHPAGICLDEPEDDCDDDDQDDDLSDYEGVDEMELDARWREAERDIPA